MTYPRPRPEEITPPERLQTPLVSSWPEPGRVRSDLRSILVFWAVLGGIWALKAWGGLGGPGFPAVGGGALAVAALAVYAGVRRRRARRAAEALPWDRDWEGPRDLLPSRPLLRRIPPALQTGGFVAGVTLVPVLDSLAGGGGTASFGCAAGAACGLGLLLAWVVFRGGAQVKLERFPYLVGERATFWIATTSGAPRLDEAEALLRCVGCPTCDACTRPRHQTTLWSDRWVAPRDAFPGPDEFVGAAFDLPSALPGTSRHGDRRVRWELLVAGRSRWGLVMETFVVPVYAPARTA